MLKDPREAPTLTISPSEDSRRVATLCETFSTCDKKKKNTNESEKA